MGIFSKKPTIAVCEMCSKTAAEGCGLLYNHVEKIGGDQPAWLPAHLRVQAPGEFTWLCVRCGSYPAMKWPSDGGARAGMMMHLGSSHYVGMLKGMPNNTFSMISASE